MADKVELKTALDAEVKSFFEKNKDVEVVYATIDGNIFRQKFVADAKRHAAQNGLDLFEYNKSQEPRAENQEQGTENQEQGIENQEQEAESQEVESEGGEAAVAGEKQEQPVIKVKAKGGKSDGKAKK